MISRAERTAFSDWAWTIDRWLLSAIILLIVCGLVFSMAGSPPVAERLHLATFHFVNRQVAYLLPALAARTQAFSVLAFAGSAGAQPIGLVNCFEGFSTFACRPLVNVHDVVVLPAFRGQRVAEKMLALVEELALQRGACKLTLEVLGGNAGAIKLYQRVGFTNYQLDPAMGQAQFLQKWLL